LTISDLFRSALHSLFAHRLRSFLTFLGMVISVSAIVAVISIISGLKQMVMDQVSILSPDMFIVSRFGVGDGMTRESWLAAWKRPNITVNDYARIRAANLPSVAEVGAGSDSSRLVSFGAKNLESTGIIGITANTATILNINFADGIGRMFTEAEDNAGRYVAIIGANIKDELFGPQDPIGRTMLIAGLPFTVVGVMPKEGESFGGGTSRDSEVYIPFSAFRRNFISPWSSIDIYIKAKDMDHLETAKDEVRSYLRAMRHTDFRAKDPFGIVTQDAVVDMFNQITAATFLFITLITGVSLFVGGIVIMNIMLVSVAERTQEIGIRMALGSKKRDVLRQFLLEATLLSIVGGIVGFLIGAGLALSVKGMTGFPAQVTFNIVVLAVGIAAAVGLTAGFLPARRAANLVIIDAIRSD
jgi:putative ABC transport system permease protein